MKNLKFKIQNGWLLLVIFNFTFFIFNSGAEITATVYPGYQFSSSERPTTANLNLLGRPTILVSGTLGGTNVALAANSVTTTMMSDTLAGSNLLWDASSPRKLVISDSGVGTNQISTDLAGLGLAGGGGLPLAVNVDTNTVQITNDVLTLNLTTFSNLVSVIATNIAGWFTTNYVATNGLASAEVAIPAVSVAITNTHTFGVAPSLVRWVLVCKTNQLGYIAGDEVDLPGLGHFSTDDQPGFATWANSSNYGIVRFTLGTPMEIARRDAGNIGDNGAITTTWWKLKAYLRQ